MNDYLVKFIFVVFPGTFILLTAQDGVLSA